MDHLKSPFACCMDIVVILPAIHLMHPNSNLVKGIYLDMVIDSLPFFETLNI